MPRMRPNAAASSRYFVPSGCATIVSATIRGTTGRLKPLAPLQVEQVREGRGRWVRRRHVAIELQSRYPGEFRNDRAGEGRGICGCPQLLERDEGRLAHLHAVGPRFAVLVAHRENQE